MSHPEAVFPFIGDDIMSAHEIRGKIDNDIARSMKELDDTVALYWDNHTYIDEYRMSVDQAIEQTVADISYEYALYCGWMEDEKPIDERGNPAAYYEYVFREQLENILTDKLHALLRERDQEGR